jgi:hypothetical protein
MRLGRNLIISLAIASVSQPAFAQHGRLNLFVAPELLVPPVQQQSAGGGMHPVAKGALIGAAAGAAFVGAVGLWYCTVGPNEVGECDNPRWLWQGLAIYGGAGAGIGALIGAIVDRR